MPLAEWRERVGVTGHDSPTLPDVLLPKVCEHAAQIKQVGAEGDRQLEVVISTETVDRQNDTIAVDGWDLIAYRSNPVVLWSHDYWSPPIGRTLSLRAEMGRLIAVAEFPEEDLHPFAFMTYRLAVASYINTSSVGFRALEWAYNEERGGYDFLRHELLEWSLVPVPANAEALIEARSAGIDLGPMKEWAERALDDVHGTPGLWLPRSTVEHVMKIVDTKTVQLISATLGQEFEDMMGQDHDAAAVKRVISYRSAHPNGTPKADEDASWDGPAEVAAAEVDDLQVMATWVDEDNEEVKGSYKLPHHEAAGQHAVVLRGIQAAAARLPQTDIPEGDVAGVQAHLGRHYREFDRVAPWDENEESWRDYSAAAAAVPDGEPVRTAALLTAFGFADEAQALDPLDLEGEKTEEEKELVDGLMVPAHPRSIGQAALDRIAAARAMNDRIAAAGELDMDDPEVRAYAEHLLLEEAKRAVERATVRLAEKDDGEDEVDIDIEELRAMLAANTEVLGARVDEVITASTGRVR